MAFAVIECALEHSMGLESAGASSAGDNGNPRVRQVGAVGSGTDRTVQVLA